MLASARPLAIAQKMHPSSATACPLKARIPRAAHNIRSGTKARAIFTRPRSRRRQATSADFANIQQEVLAHLEAADGVQLEVRIEITATTTDGVTEQQVRTVRENAVQLKFADSGFEES